MTDSLTPARRTTLLVALGVIGLVLGIVGLAADAAWLGLLAGIAALAVAGLAALAAVPGRAALSRAPAEAPAPAPVVPPAVATPAPAPAEVPATPAPAAAAATPAAASAPSSGGLADDTTGLFNEEFFRVAVETRVSAARRHLRPVAIVLFEVADVDDDGATQPAGPVEVAAAIRETLREADTACRLVDGRFAFVLEDTPEDGAIWTVERLRRKLSETSGTQIRWAGIACYPAHAFSATEALTKAERAFTAAQEWAQDRIEVATAD